MGDEDSDDPAVVSAGASTLVGAGEASPAVGAAGDSITGPVAVGWGGASGGPAAAGAAFAAVGAVGDSTCPVTVGGESADSDLASKALATRDLISAKVLLASEGRVLRSS